MQTLAPQNERGYNLGETQNNDDKDEAWALTTRG